MRDSFTKTARVDAGMETNVREAVGTATLWIDEALHTANMILNQSHSTMASETESTTKATILNNVTEKKLWDTGETRWRKAQTSLRARPRQHWRKCQSTSVDPEIGRYIVCTGTNVQKMETAAPSIFLHLNSQKHSTIWCVCEKKLRWAFFM